MMHVSDTACLPAFVDLIFLNSSLSLFLFRLLLIPSVVSASPPPSYLCSSFPSSFRQSSFPFGPSSLYFLLPFSFLFSFSLFSFLIFPFVPPSFPFLLFFPPLISLFPTLLGWAEAKALCPIVLCERWTWSYSRSCRVLVQARAERFLLK